MVAALALLVPAACSAAPAGSVELTVFAAASLSDALTAAGNVYEVDNRGVSLTLSFDASSALRTQIEQGAPGDVLASADMANPQALVDGKLAVGPVVQFARNELTIVVPAANPARIGDPRDLARPGVWIVGAGESVPISRYIDECLAKLAALPGYPAGYAAGVASNVVSREDNVRAALTKVELGEADAAFVYVTDAAASDAVEVVGIPAAANVEAVYGSVAISGSRHPAEAAAFVAWLAGPRGASILATFGFLGPAGE
ncbi:MAG: molybdate ABC transporter substrate-binding protein [Chloroflexota bacterium]